MYKDQRGNTVIGFRDIWEYLQRPLWVFMFGLLACLLAFNAGIKYSRANLEVHSITRNLAFIEIAGEEHMYELDWCEPEPLFWE